MFRGAITYGKIGANMTPWPIKASGENCDPHKAWKKSERDGMEEKEQVDTPREAEMKLIQSQKEQLLYNFLLPMK